MSSYTAAQARFNACLKAVRSVIGDLQATSQRINAAALAAAADGLTVHEATYEGLTGAWAALGREIPDRDHVLATLAPEQFRTAQRLSSQAQDAARAGTGSADRLAAAASAQLRQAVALGAAGLGRHERLASADVIVQAAANLGYSVGRCDGTSAIGIEAWRGDELMLITIRDEAVVEIDHAGLVDDACLDRQAALVAEMSRLGVDLVAVRRHHHRDERGGVLIAAAARRGDPNLARAAVLDAQGSPAAESRPAAPGVLFGSTDSGPAAGRRRSSAGVAR